MILRFSSITALMLAAIPVAAQSPAPVAEVVRANESVAAAAPRAQSDPARPAFHFAPPALWMNDPNGPLHYKGRYHLFYQHNPYGDMWGNMHWGHAVSRDLVRWEHLPIALWPSKELGEDHCFSGCAAIGPDGKPMLFYTSIGNRFPEQWAAVPLDDELKVWKKHEQNPIIANSVHADMKVYEWRDPYVFKSDNRTFLITGGNTNASAGGGAAVFLYESRNADLTEWSYRGVMFTHPDMHIKNIECPNFVRLGAKWVLIVSPHGPVEYFVGDFDPVAGKFTSNRRGVVDSNHYYAPNGLYDASGRHVLWGWIRGFKDGMGWNGCLSIPRVLSLDDSLRLIQRPAPELETIRGERNTFESEVNAGMIAEYHPNVSHSFEARLRLENHDATRFEARMLWGKDLSEHRLDISVTKSELRVGDIVAPLGDRADLPRELRLFVDRSVLEVYADEGAAVVTKVVDPYISNVKFVFSVEGGSMRLRPCEFWPLGSP